VPAGKRICALVGGATAMKVGTVACASVVLGMVATGPAIRGTSARIWLALGQPSGAT
jgi:hypothetical protein